MLKDVVIANKTYAKFNVSNEQMMDDIAVKVIRQDVPDFLLPIKMLEIDGETELRYEIAEGLRLSYLPESMTKKEFVMLFENMVRPLVECNDWFLDYHNFCLEKNYIIVGKDYTSVKYIYIPVAEYAQKDMDILDFFGDFVLNINLKDEPVYIMNLYRRIKDKSTTLHSILEYITKNAGSSAASRQEPVQQVSEPVRNVAPEPVAPKAMAPKSTAPAPQIFKKVEEAVKETVAPKVEEVKSTKSETFGKDNIQGNLISNLFGDVEDDEPKKKEKAPKKEKAVKDKNSKGLFGGIFGGSKAPAESVAPTPVRNVAPTPAPAPQPRRIERAPEVAPMSTGYDEDVTIIPEAKESASRGSKFVLELLENGGYHFPQYVEIDLSKGYATVGRYDKSGVARADYNFDASLSFISKRHFRIEQNGEQYTIVDLGSSNGTLVNNEALVPNMPQIISVGDKIILSRNQRITFRVC